jgi:hypothetical protein
MIQTQYDMTRIKQSDTISNLQYASAELQCKKCGSPLIWKTNFSDINQTKSLLTHCNKDFVISVDSVRIQTQEMDQSKSRSKNVIAGKDGKGKEDNENSNSTRNAALFFSKKVIQN